MVDWFNNQRKLRKIFDELKQPETFTNHHRRVILLQEAVQLIDYNREPTLWASLHNELGLSLISDPAGDRRENLRRAITHFERVIKAEVSKYEFLLWSQAMGNLGAAYGLLAESVTDNQQQAELLEKAINVLTEQVEAWESARMPTFDIDSDRSSFDYEQELYIWQQAKAQACINLGEAYRKRLRGNALDNSDAAGQYFEQGMEDYEDNKQSHIEMFDEWHIPRDIPVAWAIAKASYGIYLVSRWEGDLSDNVERSIECLQEALDMYKVSVHYKPQVGTTPLAPQHFMPDILPRIHKHLGMAYAKRLLGEKKDNYAQARHHILEAVAHSQDQPDSYNWADINYTRAVILPDIKELEPDLFEEIIEQLEQAKQVFKVLHHVTEWGMATGAAARFQLERVDRDEESLRAAAANCIEALQVFDAALHPVQCSNMHRTLGDLYRALHMENEAAESYLTAIRVLEDTLYSAELWDVLVVTGQYHFEAQDWLSAYQMFERAMTVDTALISSGYTEDERKRHLSKGEETYQQAAYCLIQLNRREEALETLEAGKTRLLRDMMLPIETTNASQPLIEARNRLLRLDAEYRLPSDTPARRPTDELSSLLQSARDDYRRLRTDQIGVLERLGINELLSAIPPDSAIVYFLVAEPGSYAFCIPHGAQSVGDEHLVSLEGFNLSAYKSLMLGTYEQPGWIDSYLALNRYSRPNRYASWHLAIEGLLKRIGTEIIGPIQGCPILKSIRHLIVIPYGLMQLLPLHAASHSMNGSTEYLLDQHESVSFAPSVYALAASGMRERGGRATIVGVDHYARFRPLESAVFEAKAIGYALNATPILDGQATKDRVIESLQDSGQAHFACHGVFTWFGDVHQAGIHFSEEMLSYRDILLLDLRHLRLITLSACETGQIDMHNPAEAIGLPTALLQAGAANVIASLWSVDDQSTFILMCKMYENLETMTPSKALSEAQKWLRCAEQTDITEYYRKLIDAGVLEAGTEPTLSPEPSRPYEHPYYWAAFACYGR